MLKEILVCLEGSQSTEAAIRLAIDVARTSGGALVGLAIVDEPDIRAGAATSIGGSSFKHERDEALVADARKHAADWMALFELRCREAAVQARALEVVGRPADSILEEMEKHDLTVLGRDANFRFETEREDRGTRDAILRGAECPILLVPEQAAEKLASTVLVAYDGSGAAKRAITSFARSGLALSREVHVGTVDDNGVVAREMAEAAVLMLSKEGIAAKPHNVVSVLSNTDALFKLAADVGAGLMVMGSFTRSRLRELFSGSATRGLIERTEIPLFLQH
jgi:nucleotide-binding universal stress UspA family protein